MRHRKPAAFAALVFASLLTACLGAVTNPTELRYAPELGIDFTRMTRTASGLYYEDVTVGTGAVATAGRQVRVLYRGWLPDGRLFDSRLDANNPLVLPLGTGQVIAGWDEGINGMRVGGVRKLVVPPSLGYGSQGLGPIPPNATLVFQIELVGVQ